MYLGELSEETWILSNPGGNVTVTTQPSRIPTINNPTDVTTGVIAKGDGLIRFGNEGIESDPHLLILPIGTETIGNSTFSMNVYGWRKTKLGVIGQTNTWVPVLIGSYNITLGNDSAPLGNNDLGTTSTFFGGNASCTLGPTLAGTNPIVLDWITINPGNNAVGMIKQPSFGFRYLELTFAAGSSSLSATGMNALCVRA